MWVSKVTNYVGEITDAMNSASSDQSIQYNDSSEESTSDITNVQIIGSGDRRWVRADKSDSSLSSNFAYSGTAVRSLLECLQTPKHSELSRTILSILWISVSLLNASCIGQHNLALQDYIYRSFDVAAV